MSKRKNQADKIRRCALYLRVSTEQQVEHGGSLETQETQLKNYAALNGWQVVEVYRDGGWSAKTIERPAFQRLMEDSQQDQFDVVLVTKVDRVSRNLVDLCQLVEDLDEQDVAFVSASQQFDTTAALGKLVLGILGSFAQFERDMIAERVRENMMERARKGKWNGGVLPFGYLAEDKQLVINEEEAVVVRKVFQSFLDIGTILGTTRAINEAGHKTRKGTTWWSTSIERMITNPVYIGVLRYNKRDTTGKAVVTNPESEYIDVEGAAPAIIEREQFEQVRRQLAAIKTLPKRSRTANTTLFSGLVFCGHCSSPMYLGTTRNKLKDGSFNVHQYYKCRVGSRRGKGVCQGCSIKMSDLTTTVLDQLKKLSLDNEAMAGLDSKLSGDMDVKLRQAEDDLVLVQQQIRGHEAKKRRLFELYEDELISRDEFTERRGEIQLAHDQRLQAREQLQEQIQDLRVTMPHMAAFRGKLNDLREVYDGLGYPDQKRLIQALVSRIEVGEGINLTLAIPSLVAHHEHMHTDSPSRPAGNPQETSLAESPAPPTPSGPPAAGAAPPAPTSGTPASRRGTTRRGAPA